MPNLNVTFNGAPIYIPGVYYADNVSAVLNPTQPPTPPLLVVGYGYGGKPLTPYTFTSFGNWQQFVRGGPVSNYANFIGNPSPSLNGAQYITYINASTNTQSTLTLNNSGASGVMTLKSANYGPPSNLLQAQVTIAPYFNTAGVGISLTLTDSYANTSLTGNNLGLPMQVAYLGTASSGVSFAISATAMTFTSPTAGESLTFPLGVSGYSTVASLVNAINGSNHYSAALISDTQGLLPSSGLDAATGTSLPVSGVSGLVYEVATAFVNEPAFWVNQFANTLASATGTAVATGTALPAVQGPTYFSGASGGAPVNATYASAFNVGLTTAAWTVIADSNTPAVQALGAQHAETASTTSYGKWRRFFTGSQAGDSVSTTVAKAASLNSITCCYVYPGIYRTNTSTGLNQLYDGSYAAAALAAMAAGNTINIPLTNKALTGNGLEVNLTSSQINTLQNGGVIPLALLGPNQNVPTVVSDFTTWQQDANPANVFTQEVACRWWLAYTMVNALTPFVGTIASTFTEVTILNAAVAALNSLIYTGGSSTGVLNSWDPTTLTLVYTGTNALAAISVDVVLISQNRYITVYIPVQPLQITLTASASG